MNLMVPLMGQNVNTAISSLSSRGFSGRIVGQTDSVVLYIFLI